MALRLAIGVEESEPRHIGSARGKEGGELFDELDRDRMPRQPLAIQPQLRGPDRIHHLVFFHQSTILSDGPANVFGGLVNMEVKRVTPRSIAQLEILLVRFDRGRDDRNARIDFLYLLIDGLIGRNIGVDPLSGPVRLVAKIDDHRAHVTKLLDEIAHTLPQSLLGVLTLPALDPRDWRIR